MDVTREKTSPTMGGEVLYEILCTYIPFLKFQISNIFRFFFNNYCWSSLIVLLWYVSKQNSKMIRKHNIVDTNVD